MKQIIKKLSIKQYAIISSIIIISVYICGCKVNASKLPITDLSYKKNLHHLKKFYTVQNFKLGGVYDLQDQKSYAYGGKNGKTLESLGQKPLRLAYIATGTPKRDTDGNIINAVVFLSNWLGDATYSYNTWVAGQPGNTYVGKAIVGPGKLIDTNLNYVIFLDALGLFGTSKPSDGAGIKFPAYHSLDMAQANYRLLKDHLKVKNIKLLTGVSMGANLTYIWAMLHPGYIETIMPMGGCIRLNPVTYWLFQLSKAAMQSDPVYRKTKGDYYHLPKHKHPKQGIIFGWSILRLTATADSYRIKQGWKSVQREIFHWDDKTKGDYLYKHAKGMDINDLIYRYNAFFKLKDLNIYRYYKRIKAKTIIIHVKNDRWTPYSLAVEAHSLIKNATLLTFKSDLSHLGSFKGPVKFENQLKRIFKPLHICL